jgi:hypothetical protein
MSSFELNVCRADDLLVLRFEFVNLQIDPDEAAAPRRLIRSLPAGEADAMVIVHFPPQHIGEQVFAENDFHMFDNNSKSFLAGETRLAFRVSFGHPLDPAYTGRFARLGSLTAHPCAE